MTGEMDGRPSDRKYRLFGVGCCRHLPRTPPFPEFFRALEMSEEFADGKASKAALGRAREALRSARLYRVGGRDEDDTKAALWLAEIAASENAYRRLHDELSQLAWRGPLTPESLVQAKALGRCVFGRPHRMPGVEARGLPPQVVDLACSIYDDRAFDRLPILADALEEAGCVDAGLLAHCRVDRVHAKGCWVVDLILGKS